MELKSIYLNPKNPGSFGGVERLKRASKTTSREDVKRFLYSQPGYSKHKQYFSKFPRRKVMVPCKNYLWQADLVFMRKYKKFNQNYQYILTVIDCFSKFGFAVPIRRKTSDEIIRGFEEIFKHHGKQPRFLQCDQGKEFFNAKFKNYLKRFDTTLYCNYSDFKACVVERFNRTLLTRLSKYFTASGRFEYINILPDIVDSYNNSVHRSINREPSKVTRHNETDVWLHLYRDLYTKKLKKARLALYDRVRLCKTKRTFEKGYATTFTDEIFEVCEILNTIPVTYKVRDIKQEVLSGIFYEQELLKV